MKNYILIIFAILIHNFGYAQEKLPEFEETMKWMLDFINSNSINYNLFGETNNKCLNSNWYKMQIDDYSKFDKTQIKFSKYFERCNIMCNNYEKGGIYEKHNSKIEFLLIDLLDVSEVVYNAEKFAYEFSLKFKKELNEFDDFKTYSDYDAKNEIYITNVKISSTSYSIHCTDKNQLVRLRNAFVDIIKNVGGGVNKKLY